MATHCLLRLQGVKDSQLNSIEIGKYKVQERNITQQRQIKWSIKFWNFSFNTVLSNLKKKAFVQKGNSNYIYHDICPCKLCDCCFWGRKIMQYRLEIGNDNLYYNVRGLLLQLSPLLYTFWQGDMLEHWEKKPRIMMIQDIFQDE